MKSSRHGSKEPLICVMPYARLEANVFARGDIPSRKDMRRPSSRRLYSSDRKYGAPTPNAASNMPRRQRVTIS